MEKQTCEFYDRSDIFKDCNKAWDAFANSDPDCCWGNNNRTLVTAEMIHDKLDDLLDEDDEEVAKEINIVISRLKEVGLDSYVDLES